MTNEQARAIIKLCSGCGNATEFQALPKAISGFIAVAMDVVDGERSVAKLCTSFVNSAVTSLVVGKAVDNVCGNIENNALSKLSKRELKSKVRQVHPEIKGSEINIKI